MYKKKLAVVSGILASVCIIGSAFGAGGIKLVIDGQPLVPSVALQNSNGHVMVPIRSVSEALGAKVQWDGKTQTVSIDSQGKKSLQMEVDQFVRGLAPVSPDEAVELYMNGLQQRNAALQYASFSDDLKKKSLKDFQQMNWVTGTSSPWMDNWKIVKYTQIDEQTLKYDIQTQFATSTGLEQPTSMQLTVVKTQVHWFISSIGNGK